jgi:hypothetical protein
MKSIFCIFTLPQGFGTEENIRCGYFTLRRKLPGSRSPESDRVITSANILLPEFDNKALITAKRALAIEVNA